MKTKVYKKILVTGSTAVLGAGFRSICEDFGDREFVFSSSMECDLRDHKDTCTYIGTLQPDAIIHLAAVSGGIGLSINHPARLLLDNVMMTFSVLEAARMHGVKKTIMTLSSGMYPARSPNPIREEYIHDGYPHESNYGYSFAKRLIDPAIRAYRTEHGMNVIGLVPNGIFGENDNFNYEDASMLPALIRRFYENRDGESRIAIWGDGSPLREYTYAKDIARAYLWCLDNYDSEQIINIGSTEEYSVREIALMIADIMKIDRNRIKFDLSKPSGIFRKSTDNSKFIHLSAFRYTPFKIGLEHTITWFVESAEKYPERLRVSSKVKRSTSEGRSKK